MQINSFSFTPLSMLTQTTPQQQRIELDFDSSHAGHILIQAIQGQNTLPVKEIAIHSGKYHTYILLPPPEKAVETTVHVSNLNGDILASQKLTWLPPRKWTFYVMLSSHTDIGLHNSQYIQRYNSANFLDKAMELVDKTANLPKESQYRYCMEGTWFWNNYAMERNRQAAEKVVQNYIKPGKIGIAAGLAGNCTQIYGNEELCRAAYLRKSLKEDWDIDCQTMTMIDNNGLSWALVEPYVKAGYKNIFWAPNPWNPIPTSLYTKDMNVDSGTFTPESCASGSRCDVRYDSALPMVFYWQAADQKNKLLVWTSTQYGHGGAEFGLSPSFKGEKESLPFIEMKIAKQLKKLEKKYPYDIWLFASYRDDEEPNLALAERIQKWNEKWAWPKLQMTGNLDEPFNLLKSKFNQDIPTLKGEITGGWYQLALCTPELLAQKFAVDRALPTAEKIASIAAMLNTGYEYPQQAFQRAWYALICNDEHSYGASGYQGRRVYETWMQHRAWIELAEQTAKQESQAAMKALASAVQCDEPAMLVFNPSGSTSIELLKYRDKYGNECAAPKIIPSFGYCQIPLSQFSPLNTKSHKTNTPPTVESNFYQVRFNNDGSIASIYDKLRGFFLLNKKCTGANKILYTDDNHTTFHTNTDVSFTLQKNKYEQKVIVHGKIDKLGAEIIQTITLPFYYPRIDFDNQIIHAKDMVNKDRYHRYIYVAFPFDVPKAKRYVQLNGCIAEYAKDLTGHGTDTYMAARDAVFIENEHFGIAFKQLDTSLIEFDHIHVDKTDFGASEPGSNLYSYVANDWLQMHTPGGSHIDIQCRYSLLVYDGKYTEQACSLFADDQGAPCLQCLVSPHTGTLPKEQSWLDFNGMALRLLTLKCADDHKGIIARLQETAGLKTPLPAELKTWQQYTLDETAPVPANMSFEPFETKTLRMTALTLPLRDDSTKHRNDGIPEDIGKAYSGLIDVPRAACGADDGQLYLIWGQNPEAEVIKYELYRSKDINFTPNEENFVTEVPRGEYCVALYEDTGLETHTTYYYRVRAVNSAGQKGNFSAPFCGITREEA